MLPLLLNFDEVNFLQSNSANLSHLCEKIMENMMINHWAVLACAVFNMLLGALWYSPALFYRAWKEENGLTDEDIQKANVRKREINTELGFK